MTHAEASPRLSPVHPGGGTKPADGRVLFRVLNQRGCAGDPGSITAEGIVRDHGCVMAEETVRDPREHACRGGPLRVPGEGDGGGDR